MDSTVKVCTIFKPHETHLQWSIENWAKIRYQTGIIKAETFELHELHAKLYFELDLDANKQTSVFKVSIEYSKPYLYPAISAYFCESSCEKLKMVSGGSPRRENNFLNYMFLLPDVVHGPLLVEDAISIHCDIKYYEYENKSDELVQREKLIAEASMERPIQIVESNTILDWFAELFQREELCDITFLFEDTKIKAHKILLAVKSPYFYKKFIFEADFKNTEIDYSNNEAVSSQIFRGFLEYIYGIKDIEDLKNMANKLYLLATVYDIEGLRKSCQLYVMNPKN